MNKRQQKPCPPANIVRQISGSLHWVFATHKLSCRFQAWGCARATMSGNWRSQSWWGHSCSLVPVWGPDEKSTLSLSVQTFFSCSTVQFTVSGKPNCHLLPSSACLRRAALQWPLHPQEAERTGGHLYLLRHAQIPRNQWERRCGVCLRRISYLNN